MLDVEAITQRMAEFEARADAESWSDIRRDLEMRRVAFGRNIPTDFLLDNGSEYRVGPDSYAGPRGEQKMCFMNAARLAFDKPELTYVEGKMWIYGIGIDHAWCVDADGLIVDPTIVDGHDGRIGGYFGVPFLTRYVRKAVIWNKYYGLLDYFVANKTAPQLYELGLAAGQQWLLDQGLRPPRKKKAAKRAAR